jgi:hypothetical protein
LKNKKNQEKNKKNITIKRIRIRIKSNTKIKWKKILIDEIEKKNNLEKNEKQNK